VRRNPIIRALISIASIWLAVCLAVPMQLHTCVMHGGLSIDVSAHGNGLLVEQHSFQQQSPASHRVAGHSHHDQRQDDHSKQCSCIGDCSTGKAPVALASASTRVEFLQTESAGAAPSHESPSVSSPRFLLPFSNGPPAASSRA
jgi:hypothetical protein